MISVPSNRRSTSADFSCDFSPVRAVRADMTVSNVPSRLEVGGPRSMSGRHARAGANATPRANIHRLFILDCSCLACVLANSPIPSIRFDRLATCRVFSAFNPLYSIDEDRESVRPSQLLQVRSCSLMKTKRPRSTTPCSSMTIRLTALLRHRDACCNANYTKRFDILIAPWR